MVCLQRLSRSGTRAAAPLALVFWSSLAAAGPPAETGLPQSDGAAAARVAATVNDVPIYVAQVERAVRQSLGQRDATEQVRARLRAEALEQLIQRHRALVYLQQRGLSCSQQEVDRELDRLSEQLARQEKSLQDYCRGQGIPQAALRQDVQWQLSWEPYLNKYLTDENLQRYFEDHRRHFDGTRIRVAQILLRAKTDSERGEFQRSDLLRRAGEIRDEIVSGHITFADAARKYSQAPSGSDGGQLDWIEREGPMPEFFSRVAFDLSAGEVSQVVESPYGVHLIQCLEVKPGTKTWEDRRDQLIRAVSDYVFHSLASRPETICRVQFSRAVPHFKPGTKQLIPPADRAPAAEASEIE